jgi:hypothetical protein
VPDGRRPVELVRNCGEANTSAGVPIAAHDSLRRAVWPSHRRADRLAQAPTIEQAGFIRGYKSCTGADRHGRRPGKSMARRLRQNGSADRWRRRMSAASRHQRFSRHIFFSAYAIVP